MQCQLCENFGHIAQVYRFRSHNHLEAKIFFISQSYIGDTQWILYSSTSHHVTSNSNGLQNAQDYNRPEEISMGDGNKLHQPHTGRIYLYG